MVDIHTKAAELFDLELWTMLVICLHSNAIGPLIATWLIHVVDVLNQDSNIFWKDSTQSAL